MGGAGGGIGDVRSDLGERAEVVVAARRGGDGLSVMHLERRWASLVVDHCHVG